MQEYFQAVFADRAGIYATQKAWNNTFGIPFYFGHESGFELMYGDSFLDDASFDTYFEHEFGSWPYAVQKRFVAPLFDPTCPITYYRTWFNSTAVI